MERYPRREPPGAGKQKICLQSRAKSSPEDVAADGATPHADGIAYTRFAHKLCIVDNARQIAAHQAPPFPEAAMSRSRQTLLSRFAFSAAVAGSLTFGGVQALAGDSGGAERHAYVCTTRPYDAGCEADCRFHYPEMDGIHFCGRAVPGGWECVCAE